MSKGSAEEFDFQNKNFRNKRNENRVWNERKCGQNLISKNAKQVKRLEKNFKNIDNISTIFLLNRL
jgi:hypothetical protein